jgi:hypothetical protein
MITIRQSAALADWVGCHFLNHGQANGGGGLDDNNDNDDNDSARRSSRPAGRIYEQSAAGVTQAHTHTHSNTVAAQ